MNFAIRIVVICCTTVLGPLDAGKPLNRASNPVFEIRLAETTPGEGLKESKVEGTRDKVYIRDTAIITESGVERAYQTQDANLAPALGLDFTAGAAKKMESATEKHKGRPVVILLDGKVIASIKINDTIRDRSVVSGLSEERMKQVIKAVRPKQ